MTLPKSVRSAILACLLVLVLPLQAAGNQGEDPLTYLPLAMQGHDASLIWLDASSVELAPRPGNPPLSIIDRQGRLHLLWDTFSTPRFIYHSMQTGSGWTAPAPVSPSNGTSYTLYEPFVDEQGVIHLVWRNWLGVGIEKPHRLIYSSFDGARWAPEEEVASYDYELRGMVHPGEGGEVHVTYVWSLISTHVYHTSRTQAGWSNWVEVKPVQNTNILWGDKQGGIHLYGDDYRGKVHYSYWKNGAFLVNDRVMEGRVYSRKSQLDGLNNLHLYWTGTVPVPGGQVTGLYHQCVEDNRVFGPQEAPSGSQGVSGSVARASDRDSQIGLAWRETGSQFRLGLWNGCAEAGIRKIPFPAELNLELTSLAMSAAPVKVCAVAHVLYGNTHIAKCGEMRR